MAPVGRVVKESSTIPWWLWPNVVAFDAPVVAVIWQRFLADSFGVVVPVAASVVLGLVVWSIYLTDRRLDAKVAAKQPRHLFAATHPSLFAWISAISACAAGLLALTLPVEYLALGGLIAVLVLGYLAIIHLVRLEMEGGKELLVGLLFAAGVAIPLIASDVETLAWLPAVAGFGLACWLNCRLIDRWEESTGGYDVREVLIAAGVLACVTGSPPSVGIALAMATGFLLLLDFMLPMRGEELARVLADAVLLTPLIGWCVA